MAPAPTEFNARTVETEVATLWKTRHLPPPGGTLGPPSGPTVREFLGDWTPSDFPGFVAHRAVTADVTARYLAESGRRVSATLRQGPSTPSMPPSVVPTLLSSLGIWVGGDGERPWDAEPRTPQVQAMVARLAAKAVFVTRDESFRVCPSCGALRSPERTVYDEEEGDTYLVRFPIRVGDRPVDALVWVDVPWKLLGASALLVNPNLRYVVAEYRFRETRELVLTSKSSLDRLRHWIPEAILEVLEEHTGKELQGLAYSYPLRHEFPMGGDLTAPSGTLLGAADVGDSGTGIVPLVPGHGPTDTRIADRLGVSGWPLLTPKGRFDFTLMHKYAGLDLDTANEFVLRDLSESGALLAHLRVKRGVPHCALCGTSLLWAPGRAWCLDPARLPPDVRSLFGRLLPGEAFPGTTEVAPWPVSEASMSEDPTAVALLECPRCDRLGPPDAPKSCPCGGQRALVRRKLLPSVGSALSAWARVDPFAEGDSVRIFVGRRRRVASLLHHLVAMCGVEGAVTDVALTVVPTVGLADVPDLVHAYGADAVRAAVVQSGISETAGSRFVDQCRRESVRLRRFWAIAHATAAGCDPSMIADFARPIDGFLGELEVEDRAIVARWERTRVLALADYDRAAPGIAHRRVAHFLDNELVDYHQLVRARLAPPGAPPTKRAAFRTLAYLLRSVAQLLAPVVPFTAEAVHRSLSPDRVSLFERTIPGPNRSLQNDELVAAWDRWRTVLAGVRRFRRSIGADPAERLPLLVLSTPADDVADRFRSEVALLRRVAGVSHVEVGSPREPWRGRQRVLHPVESEVQKVYPTQAKQIVHLLRRLTPRRATEMGGTEELDVVVDGLPVRIYPSMISVVETLPERVVPVPWSLGEMYLERPKESRSDRPVFPPLSPDAFWLVRRLERRLRSSRAEPGGGEPRRVALVTVKEPLASELRTVAGPAALALGLSELRIVDRAEEAVPPTAVTGRTRTGDRWWAHVPGLPALPPRSKHPRPGARLPRVATPPPTIPSEEVDFAAEKVVAREEAVRAFGRELDGIVGLPLLGPTKVAAAWDQGLRTVEDLRLAPFEVVSTLPGFGSPIAEVVVERIGGVPPPRRHRPRPRREVAESARATAGSAASASPPPILALPASSPEATPLSLPSEPAPFPPAPTPRIAPQPTPEPEPEMLSEAVTIPPAEPEPSKTAESPDETVTAPPQTLEVHEAPGEEPATSPVILSPSVDQAPPAEVPPAATEPAPPEPTPPSEESLPELTLPVGLSQSAEPVPEPDVEASLPTEPVMTDVEPEVPLVPPELPPAEPPAPAAETPAAESMQEPTVPTTEAPSPEPEAPPTATPPSEPGPTEPAVPSEEIPELPPEPPAPESPAAPITEATVEVPPIPGPAESVNVPLGAEPSVPETRATAETEPMESPAPETQLAAPEPTPPPIEPTENAPEVPATISPPPAPPEPTPPGPPVVPMAPPPTIPSPPAPVLLPPTAPAPPAPEPPLPPSGVELTIGDSLFAALGGFLDSTAAGHRGVCVVRESPERIRARVGPRPIEVFWLSNIGRGPSLRPADLEGLWSVLARKLHEEHATAFFLEGMEYLIRMHGADAVLNGLVQFDRLAREHDARVWVCLTPALMKPSDLERFRFTFGPSPPA